MNTFTITKQTLDDMESENYFGGLNGETKDEIYEFRKLVEQALDFDIPCEFNEDEREYCDQEFDRAIAIAQRELSKIKIDRESAHWHC